MADYVHSDSGGRERLGIAAAIKRHLHSAGLSRKQLVRRDLSLSTINKALAGDLSDATLAKIEAILGRSFQTEQDVHYEAPRDLGAYSLCAAESLQGTYHCIRSMFSNSGVLNSYLVSLQWDHECSCLIFEERGRPDAKHAQTGQVYIPFGKPFINFVTVDTGAVRLVIMCQPDRQGIARGLMLSLHNPRGALFIPATCPVVLRRLGSGEIPQLGYVYPEMPGYGQFKALLDSVVAEDYGLMIR